MANIEFSYLGINYKVSYPDTVNLLCGFGMPDYFNTKIPEIDTASFISDMDESDLAFLKLRKLSGDGGIFYLNGGEGICLYLNLSDDILEPDVTFEYGKGSYRFGRNANYKMLFLTEAKEILYLSVEYIALTDCCLVKYRLYSKVDNEKLKKVTHKRVSLRKNSNLNISSYLFKFTATRVSDDYL